VPSDDEWKILIDYLGGNNISGGKMKVIGTSFWTNPNKGADNSSGFSGLPGGQRNSLGTFNFIGNFGFWWTSTQHLTLDAVSWRLYSDTGRVYRTSYRATVGFSVRCIKD